MPAPLPRNGARRPDFIIIGAMKCATTTLHAQLARRSGLFMSTPKEPAFFSDDDQYARGAAWYASLFESARPDQRAGESSTHYSKLPTYPRTVERMLQARPDVKILYVMRDPMERIVSQYMHEWFFRQLDDDIDRAVARNERYAAYSSYARQLGPYLQAFSPDQVLPVFYERLSLDPDGELRRICRFIDDPSPEAPAWLRDEAPRNVSENRMRDWGPRDRLMRMPTIRAWVHKLPPHWLARARRIWQMPEKPTLCASLAEELEERLDRDLATLSRWLGAPLSVRNWKAQVTGAALEWSPAAFQGRS